MDCGYEQIAKWDEAGEYCYIHGYEPIPLGYYMICGECYHCYVTPEELLEVYNKEGREAHEHFRHLYEDNYEWMDLTDPNQVYFCPHCTHDF